MVGLSASLLLALLAQRGLNRDALQQALETLRAARPTAVNLMNNLDRMKQALASSACWSASRFRPRWASRASSRLADRPISGAPRTRRV